MVSENIIARFEKDLRKMKEVIETLFGEEVTISHFNSKQIYCSNGKDTKVQTTFELYKEGESYHVVFTDNDCPLLQFCREWTIEIQSEW